VFELVLTLHIDKTHLYSVYYFASHLYRLDSLVGLQVRSLKDCQTWIGGSPTMLTHLRRGVEQSSK